jgi:hypothetical protein
MIMTDEVNSADTETLKDGFASIGAFLRLPDVRAEFLLNGIDELMDLADFSLNLKCDGAVGFVTDEPCNIEAPCYVEGLVSEADTLDVTPEYYSLVVN